MAYQQGPSHVCEGEHPKHISSRLENLTIKLLWGYSENAVNVQLWIAICSYLLLAWLKAELKSPLTITEISKIVEASILSKADLKELLDVPEPLTQNQNVNELLLYFDDKNLSHQ